MKPLEPLFTQDVTPAQRARSLRNWRIYCLVACLIVGGYWWAHSHANPTTSPDTLATRIGAAWCDDSGYQLINRLDNSKAEIYTCNMPSGAYKCVTMQDGIDQDVTGEAKLVFAATLGADRPDCVKLG